MAKQQTRFVCQSCGHSQPKWAGQCPGCGSWNSFIEEQPTAGPPGGLGPTRGRRAGAINYHSLEGSSAPLARRVSGNGEFDRVTGGGLVPGSAVLIGGDPGIGKSTLLLQIAAQLATLSGPGSIAYISGEEAIEQIRMRARRLGLEQAPVQLATATSVRDIAAALEADPVPAMAVIDSIQTLYLDTLDSAPGTVGQVRAASHELIRVAKKKNIVLLIVGHVTKEGTLAGPRVLEHMVDTVLYFEGERSHQFRILRAVKNRFGPTDEIGVFEMTEQGLMEVPNPSALFLADRRGDISGAAVFAGIEGTRPVLLEIQALIGATSFGTPRRAVIGWDSGRLNMILAVLEARCGIAFGGHDIYLNIAGGLRVAEPAADLAVALAVLSAYSGKPMPADAVVFGEIGLSGEIRPVGQADLRLKEAAKLGFHRAIVPERRKPGPKDAQPLTEIGHLADVMTLIGPIERADG